MSTMAREQGSRRSHNPSRLLTTNQKIMLGGLGALTPILLNLLAVDLKTTFSAITIFVVVGYAIRVLILFYLGGLVAYLHRDENKPIKLFELGIVAPALLTTIISAAQIERAPKAEMAATEGHPALALFLPVVYAQSNELDRVKRFTLPKEGVASQVWRGVSGSRIPNVWFVILGSRPGLEDAQRAAKQINQQQSDFKAEVYAPYEDSQGYSVVIGANLTADDANALKRAATKQGFNASLWTFPQR